MIEERKIKIKNMKRIFHTFIVSILMISCGGEAVPATSELHEKTLNQNDQTAKQPVKVVVSAVKFGTFEVMTQDLGAMTWDQANYAISQLGDGWRLPNRLELNRLFENMERIGGFVDGQSYWSSELHNGVDPWVQNFNSDYTVPHQNYTWRDDIQNVRAIRSKK
jgi:hypothetical protein